MVGMKITSTDSTHTNFEDDIRCCFNLREGNRTACDGLDLRKDRSSTLLLHDSTLLLLMCALRTCCVVDLLMTRSIFHPPPVCKNLTRLMFARNQIWRAVQRGNSADNISLVENSEDSPEANLLLPKRVSSSDLPMKTSKQVRFSDTCRVVLIPSLKEYRSLGLHLDMWWDEKDYRYFKRSARQEVSNFVSSFGGDIKSIMKQLYQPDSGKIGLIGLET
jgi:hypothetical protein